jgi:hypothetical protein
MNESVYNVSATGRAAYRNRRARLSAPGCIGCKRSFADWELWK